MKRTDQQTEKDRIIERKSEKDRLWTVQECADFLRLQSGSLYHLVSAQRIPVIRISARCIRFDPDTIKAWVAQKTCPHAR
jgi:predicted DNA-binding transcriptional regulator AlpA